MKTKAKRIVKLIIHNLTIQLTVVSLLNLPATVNVTYAQDQGNNESAISASNVFGTLQGLTQQYVELQRQRAMQMQQNIQAQQNMQRMMMTKAQLAPKRTSDHFFRCEIAESQAPVPEHVCENVKNQSDAEFSRMLVAIADKHVSIYKMNLSEAQESTSGKVVGVQCMKKGLEDVLSSINDQKNKLNGVINRVKIMDKEFKKLLDEKVVKNLNDLSEELAGKDGKGLSPEIKRKFAAQFGNSPCKEALYGQSDLLEGKKGLRGMKNEVKETMPTANRVISNESIIKANIQKQAQNAVNMIKERGFNEWNSKVSGQGLRSDLTKGTVQMQIFPAGKEDVTSKMVRILQKQRDSFKDKFTLITSDLKKAEINLPPLDSDFNKNISTFIQNPEKEILGKMVNNCVERQYQENVGASFLNNLRLGDQRQGGTVDAYRKKISQILNDPDKDKTIIDKIGEIAQLDKLSGGIVVDIFVPGRGVQPMMPSQWFNQAITSCREEQTTNKDKVADMKNALKQLKNARDLESKYSESAYNDIINELIKCNDQPVTSGSCSDNLDAVGAGNMGCLAHSVECASFVTSCDKQIEGVIQNVEKKIENASLTFNRMVAIHEAKKKSIFSAALDESLKGSEWLKKHFDNSIFSIRPDITLDTLLKEDTEKEGLEGVKLLGGIDFPNDKSGKDKLKFQEKIGNVIKMIDGQKDIISKKVNAHIDKVKAAASKNLSAWQNLSSSCTKAVNTLADQVDQQNKKMAEDAQKKQAEEAGKGADFCRKFNAFKAHPTCDLADQFWKPALEAAGHVNASALDALAKTYNECFGDRSSDTSESPAAAKNIDFYCESSAGTLWDVYEKSVLDRKTEIEKEISEYWEDGVSEILNVENVTKIPIELNDTPAGEYIKNIIEQRDDLKGISCGDKDTDSIKSKANRILRGLSSDERRVFRTITNIGEISSNTWPECRTLHSGQKPLPSSSGGDIFGNATIRGQ